MDLSQLIDVCRDRIDDAVEPYLISDSEWTRYAIQAQQEAAERALSLLYDYTMAVVPGQAVYGLDPLIITPIRLKLEAQPAPLRQTTQRSLDRRGWHWEQETGTPSFYYQIEHKVYLFPIPEEEDVLQLRAYSYPMSNLSLPDDLLLEIPEKDHYALTYWMCWEALTKIDTELYDAQRGEKELMLFTQHFGPGRSALEIRHARELPPNMRAVQRPLVR